MDDMIGVNIRFHREQRTWTQEHLAAVSGIDARTIQRAERGTKLSADSLQALAAAFDLTVDQLRKPPKPLADAADRFKMIKLNRIERAADLRNLLPTGACQFGYDGITDEAHEDAIAEFQRDLDDAGNLWSDLDPVQKLELLRSMEHHFHDARRVRLDRRRRQRTASPSIGADRKAVHDRRAARRDLEGVRAEAVRDARPNRAGPIPITAVNGKHGWRNRAAIRDGTIRGIWLQGSFSRCSVCRM